MSPQLTWTLESRSFCMLASISPSVISMYAPWKRLEASSDDGPTAARSTPDARSRCSRCFEQDRRPSRRTPDATHSLAHCSR